ncbi:MAG: class II aldolase/adducin family protein [Myxococcota bacterium]|nr:class II aldolase/adducin family protein [Myxococcota bacterium]
MSDVDEHALRAAIVRAARHLEAAGHSPGTSGNVSARLGDAVLITPTGIPPAALEAADVVRLDAAGRPEPGGRAPSTEVPMHRALYRARPDAGAVVHCHSRFATVLACTRRSLPAVHYMIAAVGTREVPCADYATFGSDALSARILEVLGDGLGCLLANHGQIALGRDLDHAVRVAEEIEWLAEIHVRSLALGGAVPLDDAAMEAVEARFRDGYGQPGGGGTRRS